MKANSFEDLDVWKSAREISRYIYSLTEKDVFSKDHALKNQIIRAANSISLNVSEGFGRRSTKEFIYFLNVAHGSVAEVESALYLALDQEYLDQEEFDKLYDKCDHV